MRLALLFLALLLFAPSTIAQEKPASPPNILFAIADDWGLHAGAYGTKWVKTPHFDRVAREGLLFRNAYTPVAKCAPSRAALLTGRNPWTLKEAANHFCYFPSEFKTWCETLGEQGWNVGHTMKGWGPGSAKDINGKPRQMTGKSYAGRTAVPPATGINKADYAANFTDFLDAAPKNQPWCFWYGALEPHREYEYGSGVKKGGKKLSDIDRVPGYWPDNDTVRNDMLDYAFEVEHFDTHLGRMLKELEQRGQLENTLIVVTSDHGMPFPRVKGHTYEFANHVPLAMMWPKGIAKSGRTIDDFISFPDIAPTFLDVAGITWKKSGMAETNGKSLLPILKSDKSGQVEAERDFVLIGKERTDVGRPNDEGYPTRGIITGNMLYLKNFEPKRWPCGNPETGYTDTDAGATKSAILAEHRNSAGDAPWQFCFGMRPSEELYDLKTDQDCLKNLAEEKAFAEKRTALLALMTKKLEAQADPRILGKGTIFDSYKQSNPMMVNFYERFMKGEKVRAGWINPTDIDPLPKK